MVLTKDEKRVLDDAKNIFDKQVLSIEQVNYMLGRKLTDEDYRTYINSENRKNSPKQVIKQPKEIAKKPSFSFSEIAKHAAKKLREN